MQLRVITGGQSGVDEGALKGAYVYCEQRTHENEINPLRATPLTIDWECVMPKGYRRESQMPRWMHHFKEAPEKKIWCIDSENYDARTEEVCAQSQAVLMIAPPGKLTPGTKLTLQLAKGFKLQRWRFQSSNNIAVHKAEAHAIAYWLRSCMSMHRDEQFTLMVAGPRESKWNQGFSIAMNVTRYILEAYEKDIHVAPNRNV